MIRALVRWWFGIFPLATCSNCRYWLEAGGPSERGQGECRREGPRVVTFSAPQPVVIHGKQAPMQLNVQSYWPPVTPSEWCGRHERRWS